MVGAKAHQELLLHGWGWIGAEHYERSLYDQGILALRLRPDPPTGYILKDRMGPWVLEVIYQAQLGITAEAAYRIARYESFIDAADAALGNT